MNTNEMNTNKTLAENMLYEIVKIDNEYVALDYNMEEIARNVSSVELEVGIRDRGYSVKITGSKY